MSNQFPHIFIDKEPEALPYQKKKQKIEIKTKVFKNCHDHGSTLKTEFDNALLTKPPEYIENFGIYLTFSGDEDLINASKGLEYGNEIKISKIWIDESNGEVFITLFVTKGHIKRLLKKIDDYQNEIPNKRSGLTKNRPLMNSIDSIKATILKELWVGDDELMPNETLKKWCEIWIIGNKYNDFFNLCDDLKIKHCDHKGILKFIDRTVILIEVNKQDLNLLLERYAYIGEFRPINQTAKYWTTMNSELQYKYIEDLVKRTTVNKKTNTAICVLDTGVNNGHPLLSKIIADNECDSINSSWGVNDSEGNGGHGTGMCGLVAYGNVQKSLEINKNIEINHAISSVKILPKRGIENDPTSYGRVTEDGVIRSKIIHPKKDIINCMAVTEESQKSFNLHGNPSSWSATVDKIISGQNENNWAAQGEKSLFFISAGNINDGQMNYPETNMCEPVQSPGQAWNAITVGAYTKKDELENFKPLAKNGGLSPFSRTSSPWINSNWPIKPEILFEGGNKAVDDNGSYECEKGAILSLNNDITKNYLLTMNGTSPATAKAAHFAATIKSMYPNLLPETVRALMIHSAEWTNEMESQFLPQKNNRNKSDYAKILRACGYGVPNLDSALHSASNSLVLIAENEIQPYKLKDEANEASTNEMHIYELPWPKDELIKLGSVDVKLKITLSYFIEPAPLGSRTNNKYKYASYGLRFDINRPFESKDFVIQKINELENEKAKNLGLDLSSRSESPWRYSDECNINNGSVHSNVWEGTAANLAESNYVFIYPVMGWWKDRKKCACYNKKARYSLIVSLSTPETKIDIYTPVANMIKIPVPTEISITE